MDGKKTKIVLRMFIKDVSFCLMSDIIVTLIYNINNSMINCGVFNTLHASLLPGRNGGNSFENG